MTIENEAKIVDWLNRIRAIYGAEPLVVIMKGQACDGNHCPLCNSLLDESKGVYQVDMAYDTFTLYTSYKLEYEGELGLVQSDELEDGKFFYRFWGKVPDFIREFLIELDNGEYPDLSGPIPDPENSYDEDYYDQAVDHTQEEVIYEQTFTSGREWFFEEEDEEEWEDRESWDEFWNRDDLESDPF